MMDNKKWRDKEYLDSVERFAGIACKSRSTAPDFLGDKETCMMLIMQADLWGIAPQLVLANSFYDNYGSIKQRGVLMNQILSASSKVREIDIIYHGDWKTISAKAAQVNPNPKTEEPPSIPWSAEQEQGVGIEIKVTLEDDGEVNETLMLEDVSHEFRLLNPTWQSNPKKQIFNHLLRNVGHYQLRTIVNGFDTEDAALENEIHRDTGGITQNDTYAGKPNSKCLDDKQTELMPSDTSSVDSVEEEQPDIFNALKDTLETFFDECNELTPIALKKRVDSIVSDIQTAKPHLSEQESKEIKELYSEIQNVIS